MFAKFHTIAIRLPLAIVTLCLGIAAVISFLGYQAARQGLENEAENRLTLALDSHYDAIRSWLGQVEHDVGVFAQSPDVRRGAAEMIGAWRSMGSGAGDHLKDWYISRNTPPNGQRDVLVDARDGSAYSVAHASIHPFLKDLKDNRGYYDIFIIDGLGNVVYSVFKEPDFATSLTSGPWASSGLAEAYRKALSAPRGAVTFVDFLPYAPSAGQPAGFLAAKISGSAGETVGILAIQIPTGHLNELVNHAVGLGETGHITLVGADMLTRNDSRFEGEGRLLSKAEESAEVRAALAGQSGFNRASTGHDGNLAMVGYRPLEFLGTRWAVTIEQDMNELLAEATALGNRMMLTMAAAAAAAILLGIVLGQSIARPLSRVGTAMDRVASHRFDTEVPYARRKDEVGAIARNLDGFRRKLAEGEAARLMTVYKSRAFSNSSVAMSLIDRDFRIVDVNPALVDLFRRNLAEMRRLWSDFDPDKLVGACIDRFHKNPETQRRMLADPSRLPFKTDIEVGDIRMALHLSAILDDAGAYVGTMMTWEDVSASRINEGLLETIGRSQAIAEYTVEGRITRVNPRFREVFAQGPDVVGQTYSGLFGSDEETRDLWSRLGRGEAVARKMARKTRDGREVWVDTVFNPVADGKGKVYRIVELATDITGAETERRTREAERRATEAAQKQVVEQLRGALSALADGDLTVDLAQPFAPEYEELRANFNMAREKLTEAVTRMIASAGNINAGASEIAQAADDLSRRTENQAATLEETAAALDELTTSVKSAAEGASEADRAVKSARESAEASGAVVLQAVSAMSEIEKSSDQISQIIGVIDDIAFQTNLLALNAGVEAARAGEAGRGFAVVASEVRSLAQRSSEAAKEIKSLISASSQQVDRGVALVGQAGDALHRIVGSVANIATLVSEIAASSREQSTGLTEINTGVNQLDQVTQQNAAMVEESTAASHSLKQEAESLSELVAMFRVQPGGSAEVVGLSAARARPSAPARRGRPAQRTERAATGTDGWEEF